MAVWQELEVGVSDAPPGDRLLRLIHWTSAAGRQLRRRLTAVAERFELTDQELLVVWLCRQAGWVQVDLAAAIGVSPAQMSGIVERLRKRELIEMSRSQLDRRRQVWRTSDAGSGVLEAAGEVLRQLQEALSQRITADEQLLLEHHCRAVAETSQGEQQDRQHGSKEAA